ncbi:hypothetical protein UlMin_001746 [Ulmus minor]
MESTVTSTSSVSEQQASHRDELFMQQGMLFSENLNELKNLRKQLYSAAEYFELSYKKEDQKQIVVESLKDYTIKALINTVDHLGSMAYKINNFMEENIVGVSGAELKVSCMQQRLRTSADFIDRGGLFQQSLALSFTKHHKRYISPVVATMDAVEESSLPNHCVEEDLYHVGDETKDISLSVVREESSTSVHSSPGAFQFSRTASKIERRAISPLHFPITHPGPLAKRSTTINSSTSKQRYPSEPWRSVSLSIHNEREREKSPEPSGINIRLLKALVSMRKSRKDAILNKFLNDNRN